MFTLPPADFARFKQQVKCVKFIMRSASATKLFFFLNEFLIQTLIVCETFLSGTLGTFPSFGPDKHQFQMEEVSMNE